MSERVQGTTTNVSFRRCLSYHCLDVSTKSQCATCKYSKSRADSSRDADKAIARYDEWMRLREQAIANHASSGSTAPLPKHLSDDPPPRPEPYEDDGLGDVTVDLTANGLEAGESFNIDQSKDDIVPLADPGIESRSVSGLDLSLLSLLAAHCPLSILLFGFFPERIESSEKQRTRRLTSHLRPQPLSCPSVLAYTVTALLQQGHHP